MFNLVIAAFPLAVIYVTIELKKKKNSYSSLSPHIKHNKEEKEEGGAS